MSNCIELLDKATVIFLPEEIKIEEFKHLVQTATDQPGLGQTLTDNQADQYAAWWFLQKNTVFHKDGWLAIKFGQGRSTHTWRDLGHTLRVIAKYMKQVKHHAFIAADESDGFASRFKLKVEFKNAKI